MSSEKNPIPNSLNEHWMPFTSNKDFEERPRLITSAKGVYLKNHEGQTQIDASSGLFCNPLGHGRTEIIDAITNQLKTLDYAQPFQQGFGGSFELATKIAKHTPGNLNRIFYTICGSTAVETAIKISVAYHKARGEGQRFRFVGRERAYHGMNIGATSVGGMINNVKAYASVLMPGVVHMRHTHLDEHKFVSGQPETGAEIANDLERICTNFGAENIAACIVEPIAGSTGTLVPPVGYLQRLRELCDKHNILLIFDEVQTGFGRTGEMFGATKVNVEPDMVTLAKGIGGGFPLAAVVGKSKIMDSVHDAGIGSTFGASPISCAAALGVLDVFDKDNLLQKVNKQELIMEKSLETMKENFEFVGDVRGYGIMKGVEIVENKENKTASKELATKIISNSKKNGLLLVNCGKEGNVIRFMGPLTTPLNQVREAMEMFNNALEKI